MNKKHFWLIRPIFVIIMLLCVVLTGVLFYYNQILFFCIAPIVVVLLIYCATKLFFMQRDIFKMISSVELSMSNTLNSNLINLKMPLMMAGANGKILWYNNAFCDDVLRNDTNIYGADIKNILSISVDDLADSQGEIVEYDGAYFELFSFYSGYGDDILHMIYLVDITRLQNVAKAYVDERPVVMIALIDSYDDSISNKKEADRSHLISQVQQILQDYVDKTTGFIKRLGEDKYLIVVERQSLNDMIQNKFDVLDKARLIMTAERVPITLSIGVAAVRSTLSVAEQDARQALEMALGRGGDQVAIYNNGSFEFFGGFSKGIEKRTKVKTRVVASALIELIKTCNNVLIMGHRYADLDSLGSCIGMAKACISMQKPVNIVLDQKKSVANSLLSLLSDEERKILFITPDAAFDHIKERTLLIVVDTHSPSMVESEQLLSKCKDIVVIDHHRKLVSHIDKAVIFYHEPYASSTSEMVTELIQYFGDDCHLTHNDAVALLAGITLDTKSFVVKTGVRTFEAAAYLRKLGADTVEVKRLFASSMESYQLRTRVVSSAEVYKKCAIAACDFNCVDLRVVAPQAADELLNISDVDASFVLYESDGYVNISARSMGILNVQLVMEFLGGGGHHTTAAAQIKGVNCDEAKRMLKDEIDKFD